MMNPNIPEIEVSVFCLCYNHSKYIRKTLEGFVSQKTNFRYEIIVHDDASTDDSQNIIKEYANKHPSSPFVIMNLSPMSSRNLAGIIILPLASTLCSYSPINT